MRRKRKCKDDNVEKINGELFDVCEPKKARNNPRNPRTQKRIHKKRYTARGANRSALQEGGGNFYCFSNLTANKFNNEIFHLSDIPVIISRILKVSELQIINVHNASTSIISHLIL